ncbi:MAG: hypothetical protein U1F09_09650 [Steroidobacteraceae bacterium]
MIERSISRFLPIALLLLLTACGGGGGGSGSTGPGGGSGGPSDPPPPPAANASYVRLTSAVGDFVGLGRSYSYSKSNAVISVTAQGGLFNISVQGDTVWFGSFQLPSSYTSLEPGTYNGLTRYPFHDPAIGGLSWSGDGRGCNEVTGSFTIKKAMYSAGALKEIELEFTQYCDGGPAALTGVIYWNADDGTKPAGPAAIPAGLWKPAAGVTPASGNYFYLESEYGDYVGDGSTYLYTPVDATLSVSANGGLLTVGIEGNEFWSASFLAMNTRTRLDVGYYGDLLRYPFNNPTKGGLSVWGEGRGCNGLTGWFVVDRVTYSGTAMVSIDLRFEQHCEGAGPALRGALHWDSGDTTTPPGPTAPPAGLWQPAAGTTPASGNYVYLQSQPGDYIGLGRNYLYTQSDAVLYTTLTGATLGVSVNGDQLWMGSFEPMSSLSRLEVGYYGSLQRYPFSNPARGGLDWSGDGRGCNKLSGWFVVDAITYNGGTLQSVDLRFEQHCEGAGPALHGKIHWDVSDTTTPPGPTAPPPNLWEPPSGSTPSSGNYIYLESDAGDYVGAGSQYLYTQADAILSVSSRGGYFSIGVNGDESWSGAFETMYTLDRLEPGYYGNVGRQSFQNPARGGLSWSGEGRGCNKLTGWFVVDSVTYTGSTLTSIDLRFEQRCEGMASALRGRIHWDASDATKPPGPVAVPAGLWQPAPGATPASGNYVYLESEPGDFVAGGASLVYTQANALLMVNQASAHLSVTVNGDQQWTGDFTGMNSVPRLEVGYYGDLKRYPFHNPAKGGLDWSGDGRGCNELSGWFAVDAITYSGSTLTSIDLRFEQHCEGGAPALHGRIHWNANDTTQPPGPIAIPPELWRPAAGITPATGNFVYLESQWGDYIGQGGTYLYTPQNSTLKLQVTGGHLIVTTGDVTDWRGDFQTMISLTRFEVGYYGDLRRYPFSNPAKGGLNWTGQSRGCNTLNGWFIVDNAVYSGVTLMSLDLRFEQHCEGATPALRGQIHWSQ